MAVKESYTDEQPQQNPWVQTPLRESVFLKLETLQPSGSFKSRGIGNYILRRLEEFPKGTRPHIFASSGGNAGLAAVHSARALNLDCTVVVPTSTAPLMVAKLRAAGAYDVIQYGAAWKDADAYLKEEIIPNAQTETIYCPPYDHPDIWEGNSTCMYEIASQMPGGEEPDVLICSVGGGGLLNGICQAMDALSMTKTEIIAMETAGAESLNAALQAKEAITLPKITSQATSLGISRVTDATLKYAQRGNVHSVVLPDAEAAMGCWRLADDERIMVELACGINVALCYDGRLEKALGRPVSPEEKVVIVLCGGSNVTSKMLCDWRHEYAYIEEETEARRRQSDSALGSETQSRAGSVKDVDMGMSSVPMVSTMFVDQAIERGMSGNGVAIRKNTKWVTDGGRSATQRAGPQKEVHIVELKSQYGSQKASVSRNLNDISPETGHVDAARDEMKQTAAETGPVSAKPNDCTRSQAIAIDFSGLEQTRRRPDDTPISYCSTVIQDSSPVRKDTARGQEQDARTGSGTRDDDVHAGNPHDEQKTLLDSVPWYRAAKHIYATGPEGEGQRAWKAYQHIRKEHKNGARADKTMRTREQIVLKYEKPLPLPPSSGPDGVLFPSMRPRSAETRSETERDDFENQHPRKDSVFSQLSYEVPIAIEKSVGSTFDANKPLPPVPHLEAAPKPGPLIALSDGLTVNVAVECGGVGGPLAAVSLPVTRNGTPLSQSQNAHVAKKDARKPPPLNLHLPILHPAPLRTRVNAKDRGKAPNLDETPATHWRDIFVGPAHEVGESDYGGKPAFE
ncbi:farnesyltransferase alpha subunit [Stemphylium lycopersici]|nr:farnesyltransferase alpha subunit [Stemphylium lycopersici]